MDSDQLEAAEAEAAAAAAASEGSIGRRAGRGLRWSLFGNLVNKAGSFVMGLVLARLLVPEDFGLYAVALTATQFVMHINDVGIIAATVQWRGKLAEMAPTAATLAVLFSTAVYGVFWVLAPTFAEFAGSSDATGLVRLLTATILVDGITAVRAAKLLREFEQDKLIRANLIGFAANATLAITLAAHGCGPYSFVIGQVAASVITGFLVFWWAKVPVRYGFDRAIFRRLMVFGIPLAASLGVESILLNADYVIVGDVLGATALGFYLLAFNVSSWVPSLVGTAVRYVSIPSFSRLAEQRPETLNRGVQQAFTLMCTLVVPIAVFMMVLAHPLVVLLYGGEWEPAAGVLRFLAVLMIARMLTALAFDIITSLGATRLTVWLNAGWAIALVPVLVVGTHLDGIRGAGVGHAIVAVLVAIPLAVFALHRAGVHLRPVVPALVRLGGGGVAAAAVMLALNPLFHGAVLKLVVAGGLGMAVFVLIGVPRDQLALVRGKLARGGA